VLFLNARNVLIANEAMWRGSVDEAAVHVREVIARAIALGATAVILIHNHPSGNPTEEPDARQVVDLIRQAGRKAVAISGDLRGREFCEGLPGRAARELGGLDIPVNNAAYQQSKESILDITDEQFDQTFKTNVYATFRISKAAVPLMKPGAVIINNISVNSYNPGEELLDYA
jgi:NAD(P)-dependent dehydrogenase (short-subunit alcohol dehydrogenase family)